MGTHQAGGGHQSGVAGEGGVSSGRRWLRWGRAPSRRPRPAAAAHPPPPGDLPRRDCDLGARLHEASPEVHKKQQVGLRCRQRNEGGGGRVGGSGGALVRGHAPPAVVPHRPALVELTPVGRFGPLASCCAPLLPFLPPAAFLLPAAFLAGLAAAAALGAAFPPAPALRPPPPPPVAGPHGALVMASPCSTGSGFTATTALRLQRRGVGRRGEVALSAPSLRANPPAAAPAVLPAASNPARPVPPGALGLGRRLRLRWLHRVSDSATLACPDAAL